jgi:hypothetical protein
MLNRENNKFKFYKIFFKFKLEIKIKLQKYIKKIFLI